jgi:hypothetical protein
LVAAASVTVTFCVATVNPVAVKVMVYEPAGPVIPRLVNDATPLTALTVTVPINDPPEPAVMDAVTDEPVETVLLAESWKVRTGWVVKAAALTAPAAFVVLTIFVAAPTPRVIVCVATVRPVAVKVMV